MKLLGSMLIGLILVANANSQSRHTRVPDHPNDQLVLAEQYLGWYFPQLAGRNANITFSANVPLSIIAPNTKPITMQISFRVDDWCDVPQDPQRGSFGPKSFPCSQTDKNYESPLSGQIIFADHAGRIVFKGILLHGTLIDMPVNRASLTCPKPEPTQREQILSALQLGRLGALLGGPLKAAQIEHQDGGDWWVVLRMLSAHHRYQAVLDKCGTLYSLEPL